MSIKIDDLADEIARTLSEYENAIVEGTDAEAERLTKETVKGLKQESPKRAIGKTRSYKGGRRTYKGGSYAKGWGSSTEKNEFGENKQIVHNKSHWYLTHLLEKPRFARGRRSIIAGKEHIAPAEKWVVAEYIKAVKKVIRDAGR